MRFQEFSNESLFPLSIEEDHLIEKIEFSNEEKIFQKDLNERELELARQMVSKGILDRYKVDDTTFYKKS